MEGHQTLADHARCFDRGKQIEAPEHLYVLVAHKRAGREHRALDRLHHAAPASKQLFKLAAERGVSLGVLTRGLLQILDTHGADALAQNAAYLSAVRHFIDQHWAARGAPPPIPGSNPVRIVATNLDGQSDRIAGAFRHAKEFSVWAFIQSVIRSNNPDEWRIVQS